MSATAESKVELDDPLQGLLNRCATADSAALQRLYELTAPVLFAALTRSPAPPGSR
jgi:hypothetical protein